MQGREVPRKLLLIDTLFYLFLSEKEMSFFPELFVRETGNIRTTVGNQTDGITFELMKSDSEEDENKGSRALPPSL